MSSRRTFLSVAFPCFYTLTRFQFISGVSTGSPLWRKSTQTRMKLFWDPSGPSEKLPYEKGLGPRPAPFPLGHFQALSLGVASWQQRKPRTSERVTHISSCFWGRFLQLGPLGNSACLCFLKIVIFISELNKRVSTRFLLSKWILDCSSGQLGPGGPSHLGDH